MGESEGELLADRVVGEGNRANNALCLFFNSRLFSYRLLHTALVTLSSKGEEGYGGCLNEKTTERTMFSVLDKLVSLKK